MSLGQDVLGNYPFNYRIVQKQSGTGVFCIQNRLSHSFGLWVVVDDALFKERDRRFWIQNTSIPRYAETLVVKGIIPMF